MEIGPIDVVVLEFPGNKFSGELAPILRDLVASGTIRIIDLLVVTKAADGTVVTLEVAGLDERLVADLESIDIRPNGGVLEDDDVAMVADALNPDSTAALLVWENRWAAPFVAALERADARLVDQVRIPRDVVLDTLAAAGIAD